MTKEYDMLLPQLSEAFDSVAKSAACDSLATPDDAVVNSEALNELLEDLGDEGFLEALSWFEKDIRETLENVGPIGAGYDPVALGRIAHRLKGLLLQFGANTTGKLAAAVEKMPDVERPAAMVRLMERLPVVLLAVARSGQLVINHRAGRVR